MAKNALWVLYLGNSDDMSQYWLKQEDFRLQSHELSMSEEEAAVKRVGLALEDRG